MKREAEFMLARLFATLLFGAFMFVGGYLSAEVRVKRDPPCKPVPKAAEYPVTKADKAKFIRLYYRQGEVVMK
jgi:hypothetical protein